MDPITLCSAELLAVIDPGRGADVLSLVDRRSGVDVLFRSPWRDRADAIRTGQRAAFTDPVAGWLEQYRGGWQTLCPNAGDPRSVHGAPVGFHGEASTVPWCLDEVGEASARLHVDLFSVPVRIDRVVQVDGGTLRQRDVVTNLSDTDLEIDYSQHPALGESFLDGRCLIETGATRFCVDPEAPAAMARGSVHPWPHATDATGAAIDLREVPLPGARRVMFGWLEGFVDGWASVTNLDLGLTVRLEWDAQTLPYAWFWQELNASTGFPWHRRARVIAIEPASTQTSGPDRRSVLRLSANEHVEIAIGLGIENRRM